MQTSFTLTSFITLLGTLLVLALIPSVSVLTITARAAAHGFMHGLATAVGILLGDIVFILIAVYGLTMLDDIMGRQFVFIKYLGAAYLFWLGLVLWRSKPRLSDDGVKIDARLPTSFLSGLLITLADQKAILFYLALFPAYFNMADVTVTDTLIIILLAAIAISAKLVYALLADRTGRLLDNSRAISGLNRLAAGIIIVVGISLLVKNNLAGG